QKAATHAGKDVRLVLDATTGDQKRLDPVENQRVVAYLGGDIVVETGVPSKPGTLQRIELATGGVRWTVTTKSYSTGFTSATTRALVVNAPDGPAANQGVAMPVLGVADTDTGADWHETLAADPAGFVFLDDSNGKATPGRVTIAGFGTENLTKRWEFPLAAGSSVDKVKPCGPKNVCVLYSANGSYSIKSIDLSTGKEAWAADMQATSKPNWYVVGAGMIVGEERFGGLSKPELRDPATGAALRPLGSGRTTDAVIAAGGRWVLTNGVRVSGSQTFWTVGAIDVTTGKTT